MQRKHAMPGMSGEPRSAWRRSDMTNTLDSQNSNSIKAAAYLTEELAT
jgi:hypothetical protein